MPELPEVETTRRGLAARLIGRTVTRLQVREPRLRWPVPEELSTRLPGQRIESVGRRGKYLLLGTGNGWLIVHLGMSGSIRLAAAGEPLHRHDHVVWHLDDDTCLRLRDHRRFGAVLWTEADPLGHPLLASLGPEPLEPSFHGAYLHRRSHKRRLAIKSFVMDGRVVAGVGNIYATEALFRAGIDPRRAAGRVARARYDHLAVAIRAVLGEAIRRGGTTLRDFVGSSGEPGSYRQELDAYGRPGAPCPRCGGALRLTRIGQRATVFCPRCQR